MLTYVHYIRIYVITATLMSEKNYIDCYETCKLLSVCHSLAKIILEQHGNPYIVFFRKNMNSRVMNSFI